MFAGKAFENSLIKLKLGKAWDNFIKNGDRVRLVFVILPVSSDGWHILEEFTTDHIAGIAWHQRQPSGHYRALCQCVHKVGIGDVDIIDFATEEGINGKA